MEIVLPDEVPVMTLPNLAFFPQALLPLHIFEPRYRQMLRDVLATNRLFAVAGIDAKRLADPDTFEPPHRVATVGIVRACQKRATMAPPTYCSKASVAWSFLKFSPTNPSAGCAFAPLPANWARRTDRTYNGYAPSSDALLSLKRQIRPPSFRARRNGGFPAFRRKTPRPSWTSRHSACARIITSSKSSSRPSMSVSRLELFSTQFRAEIAALRLRRNLARQTFRRPHRTIENKKPRAAKPRAGFKVEPSIGIEPTTHALRKRCSTN
jgi:hypothetical protein